MTDWHRIALADCPDQSWANGAGVTRQLLAWPTADAWSLRVSVATISQSGPYSRLAQTQRWHTILRGSLSLTIDGHKTRLDHQSDPFAFDGEHPCDCELLQGPAQAFNVMTRGSFIAKVHRVRNDVSDGNGADGGAAGSSEAGQHASDFEMHFERECALAGIYAQAPTRIKQGHQVMDLDVGQWVWCDTLASGPASTQIDSEDAILVLLERTSK